MSKELEAIKYLNDTCINFLDRTKKLYCTVTFTRKRAEILRDNIAEVEQALKRLEAIDNANPSEALECLDRIGAEKLARGELIRNDDKVEPYLNTIKQALLKAQEPKQYVDELKLVEKKLKALEIIKNKTVDIWLIQNKKTLKEYNSMVDDSRKLTQEEFNLLKEVLE